MKPYRSRLSALLAALALAACASHADSEEALQARTVELKERIVEVIDDQDRVDALYFRLDQLNAAFQEQSAVIRETQAELQAAAAQYETTDEELQAILVELERETLEIRTVLEDGHFHLRGLVSEKEWKVIIQDGKGIF